MFFAAVCWFLLFVVVSVACRSILPAPAYPNIIFRAYLTSFFFFYSLFIIHVCTIVELFIYIFLRLPLLCRFSIVGVVSFVLCTVRLPKPFWVSVIVVAT